MIEAKGTTHQGLVRKKRRRGRERMLGEKGNTRQGLGRKRAVIVRDLRGDEEKSGEE